MSCRYKEDAMGGSSPAECVNSWTSKLPLCSFTYFSRMFLINTNKLLSFIRYSVWKVKLPGCLNKAFLFLFKDYLESFLWKWSLNARKKNQFPEKLRKFPHRLGVGVRGFEVGKKFYLFFTHSI